MDRATAAAAVVGVLTARALAAGAPRCCNSLVSPFNTGLSSGPRGLAASALITEVTVEESSLIAV